MNNNLEYKPVFIKNEKSVKELLKKNYICFVDAFSFQMKELFFIKNHEYIGKDKEEVYKSNDFKKFLDKNKDK